MLINQNRGHQPDIFSLFVFLKKGSNSPFFVACIDILSKTTVEFKRFKRDAICNGENPFWSWTKYRTVSYVCLFMVLLTSRYCSWPRSIRHLIELADWPRAAKWSSDLLFSFIPRSISHSATRNSITSTLSFITAMWIAAYSVLLQIIYQQQAALLAGINWTWITSLDYFCFPN